MTTYKLYEDNAGRLHLAVLEEGECIYYICDADQDFVSGTLADLKNGSDPHDWDGGEDDPKAAFQWISDAESCRNGGAWEVESGEI